MNEPIRALANEITEKFILAAPDRAAQALETLATHEILLLLSPLKAQTLVSCFNAMQPAKAAAVLRRLPLKQATHILMHLEITQASRLMQEFSGPFRERISAALPTSFLQILQESSSYAPGSAGCLMSTDFVAVKTEAKVAQLVDRLKTLPRAKLPAACFVTSKDGVLKGFIRTGELAFYSVDSVCGSVMTPCEGISPQLAEEALEERLNSSETDLLPVVNEKQVLVGVLNRWMVQTPKKPFWKKWAS